MANREDYIADGIEEIDDARVPGWWKNIMLTLLIFSAIYMLYYHIGAPGRSLADAHDRDLAAATRKLFGEIGELAPDEPTILRYMEKENWVKVGKVVFKSNCATCHGLEGEGKVGPNLTDENYKHVRGVSDIAKVILEGANNNAMPAWQDKLHPNEVVLVSAYVANLRGRNVEGGKGAEGGEIAPWPDAPPEEAPAPSAAESGGSAPSATEAEIAETKST